MLLKRQEPHIMRYIVAIMLTLALAGCATLAPVNELDMPRACATHNEVGCPTNFHPHND